MKSGHTVMMRVPGVSDPKPIPAHLAKKAHDELGATVYRPPLSTGQQAVKYFADPLPALGGFAGGLTAGAADAAAGIPTGGTAWLGMAPAVAGGSLVGGGLGSAAQMGLYKAAGIPFDERPLAMAGKVVKDASVEAVTGVGGLGVGGLFNRSAPALAKGAIGNATAGLEREVVASGKPVSKASIEGFKGSVKGLVDEVTARAKDLDSKVTFTWNDLAGKLRGSKAAAEANDVVTRRGEKALAHALETLRTKFGPASRVESVKLGKDASGYSRGRAIDPHFLVPEGEAIKPSQLADVMRYARQRITDLIEQRKVPGGTAKPAGPLEKAYSDIYDTALGLLKERDPAIGEAGLKMQKMYELSGAYNDALERAPSKLGSVVSALSGMPFPDAMSRAAIAMGSPGARMTGRAIPAAANATVRGFGGLGAPADATDTQLIEQAMRRRQ